MGQLLTHLLVGLSWYTAVIDSVRTSTVAVSKMTELETNPLPENQTKNQSSLYTFARHYKVLMWKNFVLRRRRPVFLAAELLVPILFPVILIVVRSRAIDVKESTCYAQSISMPSMGLLTYVQSMLCNFQYRCQTTDPSRFKSIIDHKELVEALHEISLLAQDPWISQVLSAAIASRMDNLSIPNAQTFEKFQRVVQAVSKVMDGPSNIPEPSSSNDDSQTVHLFGFNVSLATLNRIGNLSSTICSSPPEENDIGQIVLWIKSLTTNTNNIQTLFPMSVRSSSPSNIVRHRRSVKPTPRTIRTKPARALCTELKHFLTISKIHKYTERLRFFLFGMVYYYPATSYTDEIMHRAAAPRRLLKRVHAVVKRYLDHTSPGLHRLLDSDMTTEIVQTLYRICDRLDFSGDSQTVHQFCRKISPLLNNSIAHIKFLNQLDEWMLLFHEILSCSEPYLHLLPVQSEEEFQSLLVFFQQSTFPSAIGVNFSLVPSVNMTNSRIPSSSAAQFFEVVLRKIETTHQFRVFDRFWTPSPRQNPLSGDMNYLTGGFLDLQESISEAIIGMVSGRPDPLERIADVPSLFSDVVPGTELKLNPTPCYLNRGFIATFARILPQFLLFIWVFTAMLSTKYIVEEKEQRLKEFTRIMGLSTTIHWLGWFTITAAIMMVSVLAITLVLKFGNLIPAANYIMLLCFFLSYIVAVIALIFLCSTFFTQANLGAVVTGMVYFILFLPTPFLLTNEAVLTEAAVFGACLSCQVAFTMGLYYFMRIETQGFGAQWPDFWQTRHSNDVFSIGKCMLMLWVDTLIYMFFTWYIDTVHPGKYAVGRPACFLFTREYWHGSISASTASLADVCSVNQESDAEEQQDPRYFEQEIDRQPSTGFFKHIDASGDESPGCVCEEVRKLGIMAYGLSDTSLEEIFLELADDPADHQIDNPTDSQAPESFNEVTGLSQTSYFVRRRAQLDAIRMSARMSKFTDDGKLPLPATRRSLINRSHVYPQTAGSVLVDCQGLTRSFHVSVAQQFRAMFHKRFHHFKRYKRGWAIEFLLPVTLIILALLFVSFVVPPYSNPPMPIHPWLMTVRGHKLHVFYENNMYATGDPDLNSSELQIIRHVASNYEKALTMPYSFTGTRCIPSSVYQIIPNDIGSCEHRTKPPTWNPPGQLSVAEQDVARNTSSVQCSCVEGPQQCPANAIRPNPPPTMELQTTDILYNLTAYNVTDYLLKTRNLFINKRFGGISFIAASNPLARGSLETLLNPQNPVFSLLGSLTPISPSIPDPFWSQAADALRLMLPPTHHLQIWFDNKGYVSAPAYLNMLQNMRLRMLLANGTSLDTLETHRSAGIAIVNHPVELPPNVAIARSSRTLMLDVTLAIFTILALSFIPASLITFLVMERHTGSKHLQFVSGLNAYVYWISVYLWDIMNYLIPAGLCILVFVAFQKYAYVGTDTIGPFILLIFFYGLAVLPMLYPFSFVIRSPSTALVVLAIVNVLLGALTVTVTFFLDILSQDDPTLTPANNVLKLFFLVLPQYCLGRGLYDLAFREFILRFRDTIFIDVTVYENPLEWGLLGRKLCALGLQTVIFLLIVLCIENRFFKGPIKTYFRKRYPKLAKRRLIKLQKKVTKIASDQSLVANDVQFEQRRIFKVSRPDVKPTNLLLHFWYVQLF
ncbi:hypothetical protein EG68_06325 [Paragonimus skrjabini miyazakii]|uniref:ABC-2 type transporter transmembrane domain-containing protein n=1 Tax=Paragonimus skrjabini miyazakii TaxID=59628 RepID=A0A8S9YUJ8_9TREM|nr:hypothetical protein EG68_06325 [Paragonimus skrjabini miyazakii]